MRKLTILAVFSLCICSCIGSQKRLQRRVEKHGIKESIDFVTNKYPEYFKSKDTTIHDTTIIEKLVKVPVIDTTVILVDSSNFYSYQSDSLSLIINKLTGRLKIQIKPRTIFIHDTVTVSIQCPEIICPDCDDLKDYTKKESSFEWWWLLIAGVLLTAFYIWINRNVKN